MKKAFHPDPSAPDSSGLSTEELLAIIAEKDAQMEQAVASVTNRFPINNA